MYKFIAILAVVVVFYACSGAEELMVNAPEQPTTNTVSSSSVSSTNNVSSSSKSSSSTSASSSSSTVSSSSSITSSSVASSSSTLSSSSSSAISSSSSSTTSSSSSASSTGPVMATGYTLEFDGITAISHLQSSYYVWMGYWLSYSQTSWTMTVKLIPENAVNSITITSADPTSLTATKVSGVNQWTLRAYKLIALSRGLYLTVNIAGLTTAYPQFLVTDTKPL